VYLFLLLAKLKMVMFDMVMFVVSAVVNVVAKSFGPERLNDVANS